MSRILVGIAYNNLPTKPNLLKDFAAIPLRDILKQVDDGSLIGKPVKLEHMPDKIIGQIVGAQVLRGKMDCLMIQYEIFDKGHGRDIIKKIDSEQTYPQLSLSHDAITKQIDELSIVNKPFRPMSITLESAALKQDGKPAMISCNADLAEAFLKQNGYVLNGVNDNRLSMATEQLPVQPVVDKVLTHEEKIDLGAKELSSIKLSDNVKYLLSTMKQEMEKNEQYAKIGEDTFNEMKTEVETHLRKAYNEGSGSVVLKDVTDNLIQSLLSDNNKIINYYNELKKNIKTSPPTSKNNENNIVTTPPKEDEKVKQLFSNFVKKATGSLDTSVNKRKREDSNDPQPSPGQSSYQDQQKKTKSSVSSVFSTLLDKSRDVRDDNEKALHFYKIKTSVNANDRSPHDKGFLSGLRHAYDILLNDDYNFTNLLSMNNDNDM